MPVAVVSWENTPWHLPSPVNSHCPLDVVIKPHTFWFKSSRCARLRVGCVASAPPGGYSLWTPAGRANPGIATAAQIKLAAWRWRRSRLPGVSQNTNHRNRDQVMGWGPDLEAAVGGEISCFPSPPPSRLIPKGQSHAPGRENHFYCQ